MGVVDDSRGCAWHESIDGTRGTIYLWGLSRLRDIEEGTWTIRCTNKANTEVVSSPDPGAVSMSFHRGAAWTDDPNFRSRRPLAVYRFLAAAVIAQRILMKSAKGNVRMISSWIESAHLF